MIKKLLVLIVVCFSFSSLIAQIKSPEEFLGYKLGERFTRGHQVIAYFEYIAENSPKVKLIPYGESYEKRPLILAFVSSEENLAKMETIRNDNLIRAGLRNGNITTEVSAVWMSYNVHGNEAVSTEASMATIYELVREDSDKSEWLENTMVIIDPCVNPDGRERYVSFYSQYGNLPYNPDPNSWEHHEPWPGGRSNHYLFDLNRDWAWQTQIETKQRMAVYNQWLPQVHVDFHEQGINSPYYFAPAAEPFHELVTDWQRDFQTQIGRNHVRYFDQENWFYFTKQQFDLLYPSYGDTYPTYSGAVGMTYEQAGSGRAGLGIIKQEGDTLTLTERISHHFTTGISTIEVTAQNNQRVLSEFRQFFNQPVASQYKTYVLKYTGNDDKFKDLKRWLDSQGILYGSARGKGLTGYNYHTKRVNSFDIEEKDIVVSVNQPKSILTTVLFEPQTKLVDSLTYDITAWAVPYSFGIKAYATTAELKVSTNTSKATFTANQPQKIYGYIFKWDNLDDARLLAHFFKEKIKVRFTKKPLTIDNRVYGRGSFLVTQRDNNIPDFGKVVTEAANKFERKAFPIKSGYVMEGPDIGSTDITYVKAPRVAIVGGEGTSSLDYGATWHFMEQQLEYPVTTLSVDYFSRVELSEYDVLIMQNGWYSSFDENDIRKIVSWVHKGGRLIAVQGAMKRFLNKEYTQLREFNNNREEALFEKIKYETRAQLQLVPEAEEERYKMREYVAGAVFRVTMDNTHPLGYGYDKEYYSLKTSPERYAFLNTNNVGLVKSPEDHLSGFAGQIVKEKVRQSLIFGVEEMGAGEIVYMVDNPLFRSFWYNGKLLFANALFYVGN